MPKAGSQRWGLAMKADRARDALLRFLYLDLPRSLIFGYVTALVFLYTFIKTHTPLTVYASAPHDDTLFMRLGWNLASGRWLGTTTNLH